MPKSDDRSPEGRHDDLRLSKAIARKLNKVATGPLLGPVELRGLDGNAVGVSVTISTLGTLQSVRERVARARGQ